MQKRGACKIHFDSCLFLILKCIAVKLCKFGFYFFITVHSVKALLTKIPIAFISGTCPQVFAHHLIPQEGMRVK